MDWTVTSVTDDGDHWEIVYFAEDDTARERGRSVQIPHDAVANRMAVYGFTDPAAALESIVLEVHWRDDVVPGLDPRDDPAVVNGWVTTSGPDAVPVDAFTARSTDDAGGAHRARLAAVPLNLADPDGLLPTPEADPARVRHHLRHTDLLRWELVYGGLPKAPRNHLKEG